MFRFFSFLFGIAAGFTLALVVLPIPGKTFFNRMSKLPPSAKDLIDHSISVGISFFRLAFVAGKEFNHRFSDIMRDTKAKIDELNDKYSDELNKFKAKRNGNPESSKEEVSV
ncbi:MAG: hypothetical protein OXU45_08765 [Candidatus Melainabacteria bacterium]|nr:hypothetical protein [Candidatus Melainabacteria bacterium]